MPLRIGYLVKDQEDTKNIQAWILTTKMDEFDSVFVSKDGLYIHVQCLLRDNVSNELIGKLVYTLKNDDERKASKIAG